MTKSTSFGTGYDWRWWYHEKTSVDFGVVWYPSWLPAVSRSLRNFPSVWIMKMRIWSSHSQLRILSGIEPISEMREIMSKYRAVTIHIPILNYNRYTIWLTCTWASGPSLSCFWFRFLERLLHIVISNTQTRFLFVFQPEWVRVIRDTENSTRSTTCRWSLTGSKLVLSSLVLRIGPIWQHTNMSITYWRSQSRFTYIAPTATTAWRGAAATRWSSCSTSPTTTTAAGTAWAHSHRWRSAAIVPLSSEDHIIKRAHLQSSLSPCGEMVGSRDGSTRTLWGTDWPILVEGGCALDRRFINSLALIYVVCSSITGESTLIRATGTGVIGSVRLGDIELYKGVGGPSINGKITVPIRTICTTIVDNADVMLADWFGGGQWQRSYIGPPGFHPFPPTKFPLPDHVTLYWPAGPLVYVTSAPPSVQKE